MIRIGDPANGIWTKTVHKALSWGGGWGSDIRTKVKSLKINSAGKTKNCESLLLKIIYLNIFEENHNKEASRLYAELLSHHAHASR